jgi:hypothetical protein
MNEEHYPISWRRKINPFWWIGNFNDPVNGVDPNGKPKHTDFHPKKPLWVRKFLWACRNPLHNFFFFVIGFEDRKGIVNLGNQWPGAGQKWNIILPFISYRGTKWEFYIGWREGVRVGAAFRRANSRPK